MEGSSIGNVAKDWELLYFPMNILTGFVLGSVQYLNIAGCPIEFFSDRYLVTSASRKYFDNGLLRSTRSSVYLSPLSHLLGTKKCDGSFYVANPPQSVMFVCRPTRSKYGSIEVRTQMRSVTTNSFSLRELGTATQLVQVTMRSALAR
jgi:hypothetical protein